MDRIFAEHLFEKHILAGGRGEEEFVFETLFSLAQLFNIRIISGGQLARQEMISFVSEQLGQQVPEPFYRGFPQSVRELSPDQLLYDQLIHYTRTYGMGDFSEAGHSLFEKEFARTAFKEQAPIRDFRIVTEEEAEALLLQDAKDLLAGSRPLSEKQFALVKACITELSLVPEHCASKNTAIRLLLDLRDLRFARFLMLSDVTKVAEELNFREYQNGNVRKLNLKNRDRKFLTALIDSLIDAGKADIRTCAERRRIWSGLLHHLHYQPKSETGILFAREMRRKELRSVYAEFEEAMAAGEIRTAADILKKGKGTGALLRNLNYLVSRCETEEDLEYVAAQIDTDNVILLLQLLLTYADPDPDRVLRTFAFTRFNMMRIHDETEAEDARRRSFLTGRQRRFLKEQIEGQLKKTLAGRLGRVWIDPEMERYALPLQESASQGGFGVLARGSRVPIGEGQKLRAFTYWEKVDDIDLACFGITARGGVKEFSWRTMAGLYSEALDQTEQDGSIARQSEVITYSGDQTSGYHGGSEYFDIDLEGFRRKYPSVRYIVFTNNVYSDKTFSECVCRAGYMMRELEDSGQVFEPKTVASSYAVTCPSTYAYLFGVDLESRELVWLNMARDSGAHVAGEHSMAFLTDYFHATETVNLASFFTMMASEVTGDPKAAQVLLSDRITEAGEGQELIHSWDFPRILALMNASYPKGE